MAVTASSRVVLPRTMPSVRERSASRMPPGRKHADISAHSLATLAGKPAWPKKSTRASLGIGRTSTSRPAAAEKAAWVSSDEYASGPHSSKTCGLAGSAVPVPSSWAARVVPMSLTAI